MQIRSSKDFWCGLVFLGIGAAFAAGALAYPFGSAARPGPAYLPFGLGLLLALLALLPEGAKRPRLTGIRSEGVRLPLHHSKLDLLFDIQ